MWGTCTRFKTGGLSDTLNSGVFSSCGCSRVLSHEENSPVFCTLRVITSRSADIKFLCLHINNRPRHEKFSCELLTKAQRQDKFSGISAFSDMKSFHIWHIVRTADGRRAALKRESDQQVYEFIRGAEGAVNVADIYAGLHSNLSKQQIRYIITKLLNAGLIAREGGQGNRNTTYRIAQ